MQRRAQNPRLHLRLEFWFWRVGRPTKFGQRRPREIRIFALVLRRGCCSAVLRLLGGGANNPKLEAEQFANLDLNLDCASKRY